MIVSIYPSGSRLSLFINSLGIRTPKEIAAAVDEMSEENNEDRSSTVRLLLKRGMESYRVDVAVDRYKAGGISLGKAAEEAGVSIWRFLDILKERKVPLGYSKAEAEEEIKKVLMG